MALTKRVYVNHKTVITAENLNDIQDAIIALEKVVGIVPGEGEATRTISVINPNSNYTLAETVALPDGLYWFANPINFTDETQTVVFQVFGLVAKADDAWRTYDNGRTCVTDENGVLIAWDYTSLPEANSEDEGKVLAIVEGKWEVAEPQQVFPLEEAHVYPTNEPQELLPSEGYCGFSRILVDAAPEGGGDDYPGGGSGGESPGGGAAEDETFGDDYGEPTGNYDYTGGTDDNPPYIPEIPGTGYKALFSKKVKMGSYVKFARGKVWNQNYTEMVPDYVELQSNNGNFYVYATWGYSRNTDITWVSIYMYSDTAINYRYRTMLGSGKMGTWSSYTRMGAKDGFSGFWGWSTVNSISAAYTELQDYQIVRGIPFFSLGDFSDSDSYETAARALATSSDEEQGKNQFIAFVSDTQILYDGSVINNMDNSPMTIYECDANGKNTWTQIGTTDGTDYPVGAYTLVWNSHDLLDTTGQYVTHSKSDDPIPEMAPGDVGVPVERNETYTIEGETMNGLVSSAQKVTGGKTPLTPTEAKQALDDYYNHPAEEMLW